MSTKVVVCAAIAGVLGAPALAGGDDRTFDQKALKAAGEGRAVYLTYCSGCHGMNAQGGVTGTNHTAAPDLRFGGAAPHLAHHTRKRGGIIIHAQPRMRRISDNDGASLRKLMQLAQYRQ